MGVGSIFLSYWWILVFVLVVIGIVTRNVRKFLMFSAVLLVGFFILIFGLGVLVGAGFDEANSCLTQEAERINEITERAKANPSQSERKQLICTEDVAGFNSLVQCLQAAKNHHPFAFAVYRQQPSFKNTVSETITGHNQVCPEFPLTTPQL